MYALMQAEPAASKGSEAVELPALRSRLPAAPGVRQDHTEEFRICRGLYAEQRAKAMAPRLEWLLSIISSGDVQQLKHFMEAFYRQGTDAAQRGETCTYCNARVTSSKNWFRTSRQVDEQPAARCMICMKWYCEQHCKQFVNLGFATHTVKLECCEQCHRGVEVLRWRQDSVPGCLSETERQLASLHQTLFEQLTKLPGALAQLEGSSRLLEELQMPEASNGVSVDDIQECISAMKRSRVDAETAEAAIARSLALLEGQCREAVDAACNPKNGQIRDGLLRHGRQQLERLKPRLKAACTRATVTASKAETILSESRCRV
ncbi:unnamed protein product [Symbiodinium pilosum]|uniref:Uncharacterized protein n=1 Tax=Symbiodinium pilosum TaxID=2952 RepID=A0A812MNI5_SYMPI|nr:unnamed protein product [Symbiodinium pilosum]